MTPIKSHFLSPATATAPFRPLFTLGVLGLLARALIVAALLAFSWASAAQAPAPAPGAPLPSAVTETSATLSASVDPGNSKTKAHFDYIPLAAYKDDGNT